MTIGSLCVSIDAGPSRMPLLSARLGVCPCLDAACMNDERNRLPGMRIPGGAIFIFDGRPIVV